MEMKGNLMAVMRAHWDRLLAVGCVVIGAVVAILGWIGISGTALAYRQLPYLISGGVGGALFVGVGLTVYLSADLQDEWRKLDSLQADLRKVIDVISEEERTQALRAAAAPDDVPQPDRTTSPRRRSRPLKGTA